MIILPHQIRRLSRDHYNQLRHVYAIRDVCVISTRHVQRLVVFAPFHCDDILIEHTY